MKPFSNNHSIQIKFFLIGEMLHARVIRLYVVALVHHDHVMTLHRRQYGAVDMMKTDLGHMMMYLRLGGGGDQLIVHRNLAIERWLLPEFGRTLLDHVIIHSILPLIRVRPVMV